MSKHYLKLFDRFPDRRIGVVGDYLLDQYILGTTSRVSREAPIVVVDYQDTAHHPGGAANAAQNVTALGATCHAVGVVGADREGEALTALLRDRGVATTYLVALEGASTSLKLRIMAGEMNAQKQQVARVDRSHRLSLDETARRTLRDAVVETASTCDAILLADYGLGVVTDETARVAIDVCRDRKVPVVVDSRYRSLAFRGATVATPNEVEAMVALGVTNEADLMDRARLSRAIEAAGVESLIVKRGSKGMIVCGAHGLTSIGIAGSNQATDVTGAGDTVAATVTLALAAGASLEDAARMATYAAAVVVMKRGTATASPAEVRALIHAEPEMSS